MYFIQFYDYLQSTASRNPVANPAPPIHSYVNDYVSHKFFTYLIT